MSERKTFLALALVASIVLVQLAAGGLVLVQPAADGLVLVREPAADGLVEVFFIVTPPPPFLMLNPAGRDSELIVSSFGQGH